MTRLTRRNALKLALAGLAALVGPAVGTAEAAGRKKRRKRRRKHRHKHTAIPAATKR